MNYVFDTNIFVAALDPTDLFHKQCKPLMERVNAGQYFLYEPVLILPEVAGVMARRDRDKEESRAKSIYQLLLNHPQIAWLDETETTARYASELAIEAYLRGADATIVHVADLYDIPIVSMDKEILERPPERIKRLHPDEVKLP